MNTLFVAKLLLSFLVGGVWIILATVIAEKHGTKLGGIIIAFPSTALISLFFIGWTQDVYTASKAAEIVPIGIGLCSIFSLVYIMLSNKNFLFSVITSLSVWFILAFFFVSINIDNIWVSILIYLILFITTYLILEKRMDIREHSRKRVKYNLKLFVTRGILAGTVISLAVFLAKIGGPLLGGMFASFPAMMLSTIIITHLAHGSSYSSAMMKSTSISTINVVIYSISLKYSYVHLGLLLGTVVSFIISVFGAFIIYFLIIKNTK
ncbi:MAG: DUF3147 family protein [Nanoarchaeota archaeon]|nr:DUF3147 family protein [Nanoarchaeota archaeon]